MSEAMPPRILEIARSVAIERGVPLEGILSPKHTLKLAAARHAVWAVVRATPGPSGEAPSLKRIGRWFNRDHSTILVGIRAHEKRAAAK